MDTDFPFVPLGPIATTLNPYIVFAFKLVALYSNFIELLRFSVILRF